MLRITWILPGGAVLLAVVLFALAFRAPDRPHSQLMPNVRLTRVALIELGEQPESRQFRAIRRTNELNRLRELLDTQATDNTTLAGPSIALLANRSNSDPENNNDETVANVQSLTASAPVDIASLPVQAPDGNTDEKQPIGIREEKPTVAIQEEKPTVATREEKPVAIRKEKVA